MIHPLRTLAYDLLVAPFARFWRKVWGGGRAPRSSFPDGSGREGERRLRNRSPIRQT